MEALGLLLRLDCDIYNAERRKRLSDTLCLLFSISAAVIPVFQMYQIIVRLAKSSVFVSRLKGQDYV